MQAREEGVPARTGVAGVRRCRSSPLREELDDRLELRGRELLSEGRWHHPGKLLVAPRRIRVRHENAAANLICPQAATHPIERRADRRARSIDGVTTYAPLFLEELDRLHRCRQRGARGRGRGTRRCFG